MAKKTDDTGETPVKEKPKPIEVMRSVKEVYDDAAITRMARQMSYAMMERDAIKEEAKEKADAYKAQINAKETEIDSLSKSVNMGFQMVKKNCMMIKNFNSGKREYYVGEQLVDEEPLTAMDHQMELDMAVESNKKEDERTNKTEAKTDTAKDSGEKVEDKKESDDLQEVKETVTSNELSEDLKKQKTDFKEMGDEAYKKKTYGQALKYYKAAAKIDPSDQALADLVEKTQKFVDKLPKEAK